DCQLLDAAGTIPGGDVEVVLACAGALAGLAISGPTAPDLDFSPTRLTYQASVSLMQESVSITATAISAEADITVAELATGSGEPSAPLPLALGATPVAVVVTHRPTGAQRTYEVTIHRAAPIAQYTYGKASNTGQADLFGYSVAL